MNPALLALAIAAMVLTLSCNESFAEEHMHSDTLVLKPNQTMTYGSGEFDLKLVSITEDSRCPSDVTCVWEGRVTGKFLLASDKVDKTFELSSNTNREFAWNGYVLRLGDVSPYPTSDKTISPDQYIVTIEIEKSRYDSPLKQIKSGVSSSEISCNEGLEQVMKKTSGQIVCVKSSSTEKLLMRGWAVHVLPDYKNENTNSEIFAKGSYDVETKMVDYFDGVQGYLARPSSGNDFPQVVMIHEWWGLNQNIKDMAEKLASHGYVVLAVDLYEGSIATTADQARQLMGSFDKQRGIDNMNSAVAYLQENYGPNKIGSLGWCFGGGQSLNLALNNPSMDATVIYYGQLVTDSNELSKIKWPVLGIFAANDKGITVDSVNQLKSSLDKLKVSNEITIYPGVDHAFANPSGASYSPGASQDAWNKTLSFLDSNLK